MTLVAGVAIASRFLHGLVTNPTWHKAISEILIAVLVGLYIRNRIGLNPKANTGIKFAIHSVLRLGVVLLGLRLSLQDVAAPNRLETSPCRSALSPTT